MNGRMAHKKFRTGRPEWLNGLLIIPNGLPWTAERLMKNFERVDTNGLTATNNSERFVMNGRLRLGYHPERIAMNVWTAHSL